MNISTLSVSSAAPRRQTSPNLTPPQSPFWSFGDEPKGAYSIYYAAKNGTLKARFQSHLANINIPNNEGITALHIACENGEDEVVEALLECGANSNLQNKKGMTPLHFACDNGYTNIVAKMLKSESIELELENEEGKTPLSLAMSKNHGKIASLLKRKINTETLTYLSCVVEASETDDTNNTSDINNTDDTNDTKKLNIKGLDDYRHLYKEIAKYLIIKA